MATNQLCMPGRLIPAVLLLCSGLLPLLPEATTAAQGRTRDSLPRELRYISGPVNGALLTREGKTLAIYGEPSGRQPSADMVLLTEARRDAAWGARALALRGAKVVAPASEAELLEQPEKFWAELRERRFHDYSQQSTKVPGERLPV